MNRLARGIVFSIVAATSMRAQARPSALPPSTDRAVAALKVQLEAQQAAFLRGRVVNDTAMFVKLGEPPVNDSAAFDAWQRAAKLLFGEAKVRVSRASDITAFIGRHWSSEQLAPEVANLLQSLNKPLRGADGLKLQVSMAAIPEAAYASDSWVPATKAEAELITAIVALLPNADIDAYPMRVAFGERPITEDDRRLDGFTNKFFSDTKNAIGNAAPLRRTLLAVLDSGWPSDSARANSIMMLDSLCAEARTAVGVMIPINRYAIGVDAVGSDNEHVRYVAETLDTLRRIPNDSLTVVFLPLAASRGDAPLLRNLLLTHLLVTEQVNRLRNTGKCRHRETKLLLKCFQANPMVAVPGDVAKRVDYVMQYLTNPRGAGQYQDQIFTTVDIFNAVFTLFDLWSTTRGGTQTFINASWTADTYPAILPALTRFDGRVLTVAAAGNSDSLASTNRDEDFVQRAFKKSGDFVLVESRRVSGESMCYTTRLDVANMNEAGSLIMHSGLVPSRRACGTSFAAPRVAWTLAFAETIRSVRCPRGADSKRRLAAMNASRGSPMEWSIRYLGSASRTSPIPLGIAGGCT